MKYGREGLEDDALLRVLKTITLRLILVVTIESLYSHIVFERVVQVLHALDVELNICAEREDPIQKPAQTTAYR